MLSLIQRGTLNWFFGITTSILFDLDHRYVLKNVRIKSTKFENYLNTPKNEDFTAVDAAAFDVAVAVYEDEIDTTMAVMAKFL